MAHQIFTARRYAVARCLSAHMSVTPLYGVKTL